MSHTPHELAEAFPEHRDAIQRLRGENAHFARLAEEHHALNRQIHRAETDIEPMDDFALEDLKKRRLKLLDEISAILAGA